MSMTLAMIPLTSMIPLQFLFQFPLLLFMNTNIIIHLDSMNSISISST